MADRSHLHLFPSTRWTLVARAGHFDEATRTKALSELCELYWPPVYAFVRSKGNSPADAEDITQGFFAKLLSREDLARTDRDRGKLRSFLLAAVKNYMSSEWRKANRQRRGGDRVVLSLNQEEAEGHLHAHELKDETTPDKVFERQWALTLLSHALQRLEERYREDGKGALFDYLKPALTPGAPMQSYGKIAAELGLSVSAMKVGVHRLRQRYGVMLRQTIADTLGPGEDADEELRHLRSVFQ